MFTCVFWSFSCLLQLEVLALSCLPQLAPSMCFSLLRRSGLSFRFLTYSSRMFLLISDPFAQTRDFYATQNHVTHALSGLKLTLATTPFLFFSFSLT
ncbi:hypothetical protein BS17DRAFT_785546 [Gyrodon lividus]|nr:hypothetical protein BS17DRAFT_785546 [Gyrodon lividus]